MKEVVLTNEELDIIDRLQNSQFPSAGYDPYEVCCNFLWIDVNGFHWVYYNFQTICQAEVLCIVL